MGGTVLLDPVVTGGLSGYVWDVARSLLALGGLVGLCVLGLRGAKWHRVGGGLGPLQVVQRLALGPRRSLYVVRAGDRLLLLGCGESGAPSLITELAGGPPPPAAHIRELAVQPQPQPHELVR